MLKRLVTAVLVVVSVGAAAAGSDRQDPRSRPEGGSLRAGRRRHARPRRRHARRDDRVGVGRRARPRGRAAAGRRQRHLLPVLSARAIPGVGEQHGHARRQGAAHGPRRRHRRHRRCERRRAGHGRGRATASRDSRSRIACSSSATRRRSSRRRTGPATRRRCAPGCAAFSARRTASAPAAIVAIVPDEAVDQWDRVAVAFPRGTLRPRSRRHGRAAGARRAACRCSTSANPRSAAPLKTDARLVASISTDSFTYPSVNIVAKVPGRDARLARRIRALQRAPGSRRRALPGERRQHLERRRRQRDDRGRAAGDRPRDVGAAGTAIGALRLARRRGARA